jgi:methylmalonyl-CoA/ethylmalonyl-CoA epimerase
MDSSVTESMLPKQLADLVIEIDHVAIAVQDLDVAIRWYSRGLGLSLVERRTTKGERTSMTSAVLKAGRTIIVLIQGVEPDSQVCRFIEHFGPGVQHLALAVRDLDAALAALQAEGGGSETPIIADDGIRQAFLRRDPGSGVRIELIERKGGNFTDRSVEQLFRAFERQGLY